MNPGRDAADRRDAIYAHLVHSITDGVEVKPGSIPELSDSEDHSRPTLPASVLEQALRCVPEDKVRRPGLRLQGLTVIGDLDLSYLDFPEGVQFTDCVLAGSLDLTEARVAAIGLYKSRVKSGNAVYSINAPNLVAADAVVLPEAVDRPINLTAAKIGGNLAGCPSLDPGVGGSWVLDAMGIEVGGVISVGVPDLRWGGAINLFSAVVSGGTRIAGVVEQPASGAALDMSWGEFGEDLDIRVRIDEVTDHDHPAVQIAHATVKRDLTIRVALTDASVDCTDVSVGGCFRTVQEGLRPQGSLSLSGLDAGELDLGAHQSDLPTLRQLTRVKIENVSGRLGEHPKSARAWLDGAESFTTQPWEEFARVYSANGQPASARNMRYWAARRATKQSPWPTRVLRNLYWITTGHGYYPLLSLAWLAGLFGLAFAITTSHHDQFTTPMTSTIAGAISVENGTRTNTATDPGTGRVAAAKCRDRSWDTPCLSDAEYAIGVTLSPISDASPWEPPAGWVGAVLLAVRALSWIFVALLLAGVTGLLRRE